MRLLSTALACLLSVSLSAQEQVITYPYNPDADSDSLIAVPDALEFLTLYGNEFIPEPVTVDGVVITEWLENNSNSSGGGGCDYQFPEGLHGEVVLHDLVQSYTVPEGKNLYIYHLFNGPSQNIYIDDVILSSGQFFSQGQNKVISLVVSENQVISSESDNPNNATFVGVLIESFEVSAITIDIRLNSYTVPDGKKLYINHLYNTTNSQDVYIDNFKIAQGDINNGTGYTSNIRIIVNSGQTIFASEIEYNSSFNGYLVDEDYFADCGGGGGSSGGSVSSLDSLTIVNMINDALSNSVSIGVGDYYSGGIVGYIFQPGDADYILGETHGYTLYFDDTDHDWGCMGITTNVTDNTLGQGPINTQTLSNLCPEISFAAKWCDDLVIGPYDDWFLPTYGEASLVGGTFYSNNFANGGDIWIWLSEDYSNPNNYNYDCPFCNPIADFAFVLRDQNNGFIIDASPKNSDKKVVAFRKF